MKEKVMDLTPTNEERGAKALRSLTEYEAHSETDTNAIDLMADMMHLLGEDQFASCLASAELNYITERAGEGVV